MQFGNTSPRFSSLNYPLSDWTLSPYTLEAEAFPIILWQIWMARNNSKFQQQAFSYSLLISRIERQLFLLCSARHFHYSTGLNQFLSYYCSLPFPHPRKFLFPIHCTPPPVPFFNMNFDGAFCLKYASIGGCLRDSLGNVVAAYCSKVLATSALQAELPAALVGIRICTLLNFKNVWLESDSRQVINILSHSPAPADCFHFHAEIMSWLGSTQVRLKYIFRESNMVAHLLPKTGRTYNQLKCFLAENLPRKVSGVSLLDKSNFPTLECNLSSH